MQKYHELKTVVLDDYTNISRTASPECPTLDSPAIAMMTDFRLTEPLTLHLDESIDDAVRAMRKMHVRSVIVTDADEIFRGIVTVADLESRKVLSQASSLGLKRGDLSIADVMITRNALRGITLEAMLQGSIGDLLSTLRNEGRQHMLVVDPDQGTICGIVSASEIARQLRIPVEINLRATSFRELVDVLFGRGEAA